MEFRNITNLLSVAAVASTIAVASEAAVVIDVQEVGGNVVFITSGSLDLTGATYLNGNGYQDGVISSGSNWYIASGSGSFADNYAMTSFDGAFGTNSSFLSNPNITSGNDFFIWGNSGGTEQIGVQEGYTSGSAINSMLSFFDTSFAAMGLTIGIYNYAIPSDSITLNIGGESPSPVPLPATGLLLMGALAGVGALRRRKKS